MEGYTLAELPEEAQKALLQSHTIKNLKEYRAYKESLERQAKAKEAAQEGLFAGQEIPVTKEAKAVAPAVKISKIIWATDNYDEHGANFFKPLEHKLVKHIVPRSEKAKDLQKKRTKEKAEVFTPSWVCNMQNNLIDSATLYEGAFNIANNEDKSWEPTLEAIDFTKTEAIKTDPEYTWLHYVASRRLEITAGEGPYLMSRYDTVTGEAIPVRDARGAFLRIGLLDRKFRVIAENLDRNDKDFKTVWLELAKLALKSTYGYEWQGDNLLLARLNFLNSFVDYYKDAFGELPGDETLVEVAKIASQQLWQMDGLKMVVPLSCSETCDACAKKLKKGHDGVAPVIYWGDRKVIFDDFMD